MQKDIQDIKQLLETLVESVGELKADVGELKADVGVLKADVKDLGFIKGYVAWQLAVADTEAIARLYGLSWQHNLSQNYLADLAQRHRGGAVEGDLESFSRADLVMEARDANDRSSYVAVEISFTADEHDVERAIRNAKWLTKFTGKNAYPVIASVRRDDFAEGIVQGQIKWYKLETE